MMNWWYIKTDRKKHRIKIMWILYFSHFIHTKVTTITFAKQIRFNFFIFALLSELSIEAIQLAVSFTFMQKNIYSQSVIAKASRCNQQRRAANNFPSWTPFSFLFNPLLLFSNAYGMQYGHSTQNLYIPQSSKSYLQTHFHSHDERKSQRRHNIVPLSS